MSALLEVRGISHRFRGLQVLKGVNLKVDAGTITGLIGPNGAGKSTLFNVISGFLTPDAGLVLYDGRDVSGLSVPARSHAGLVRTFQTPQVFGHLSVLENLIAGSYKQTRSGMLANLLGTPGSRGDMARMRSAAEEACERFNLTEVRHRAAGKLPGGQQRLLELARAWVGRPRLLCLDEPSSGLNSEEVAHLMQILTALNREGLTILLVSHDMELVTVAASIHVLCFGEIIASGPFPKIQGDARVREAYLGL